MESPVAGNQGTVSEAGASEQSRYKPRHRTVSSTTIMSESSTPGPNQPSMRMRPGGVTAAGGAQAGASGAVVLRGVWAWSARGGSGWASGCGDVRVLWVTEISK